MAFISLVCTLPAQTQTFTTLLSLNYTDGAHPDQALIQGIDGNLYGTTTYGGANSFGTVFKIALDGTFSSVYSFCLKSGCADGEYPVAGLVQSANGDFYGTTSHGGTFGGGTVFKITSGGALTTLYSFCSHYYYTCTDGESPVELIKAHNGDFYGMTIGGGDPNNGGTVFKITPEGALTTIYRFCSQAGCPDGTTPNAALVQARDGDFYGITQGGGPGCSGPAFCGTVFKLTGSGTLTTLYRFCSQIACADGTLPIGGLVQAKNGKFYGTTSHGGSAFCQGTGCGTIFTITPAGELTTLHSFCSRGVCMGGEFPTTALIQATDGNLYGTTHADPGNGSGTIFRITPVGVLTTVYEFCSQSGCADGALPTAGLVEASNGVLYGTTSTGGTSNNGTVFSLSVGLAYP